jgi:hypothetical protein
MARARNIKPGFFRNELLVEMPFEFRLLFIGTWTIADRAGRFEDRPTRIKMDVFPADPVDVDAGLQALHDKGFIERYTVDGVRYCQVLAWGKHQNPHMKEAHSIIPPPEKNGASTVQAPCKNDASPEITGTSPADSLIPDSLIPDSLQELTPPLCGDSPPAPEKKPKRETGCRLPADWAPDDALLAWARAERPDIDPLRELARFRDHWNAKTGKDATKADWPATFRNWIRGAFRQQKTGLPPQIGGSRVGGRML